MLLESQNKDLAPILSDTDLKKLFEKIPDSWSVIALSNGRGTYNDGVHLMRYFKGFDPFCTTIGGHCECTESSNLFTILENFANIMKQSANTTNSTGNIKKNSNAWWHKREKLNDHLELWLDDLQNKYLRHFATLFLGKIIDDDIHKLVLEAANEFLAAKICDNCGQMWETSYIYSLINAGISDYFTSEDIKQASLLIFSNKVTDDFLKRIRSIRKISQNKEIKRGPIVLLLDGNLIHLPLESIKILRDQTVSRLPGLSFLIPRLNPYQLSLSNTFYILNPSSDLEHTQQTFEKSFLDRQNWQGIIDQAPTESEFVRALEEKDLLIYCGHSSGEQYIKGDRIKELNIRAVSLLMGCSSGLLRPCGQFEPQGVVLQYLLGGCPGIIANLWDVTDRDIDRLSLEFIKRITNLEPFGEALHKSRKACKLNYLIGAAPVYYGVPLTLNL